MNQSKWNAWYIAKAIEKHAPNGLNEFKIRELIERTCGTDKRTIKKYWRILMANKYIIVDSSNPSIYKTNPKLDDLTPKSPKQLLDEWED